MMSEQDALVTLLGKLEELYQTANDLLKKTPENTQTWRKINYWRYTTKQEIKEIKQTLSQ